MYSDQWASIPGMGAAVETYEAAFRWGPAGLGLITPGWIDSAAVDSGNTPTYVLRPGLVLGIKTSTGTWINYSPTATDGSQVARGVLITAIVAQNFFTGAAQQTFYGILVGGPVQAAKLIGLDGMARADMTPFFQFDDFATTPAGTYYPWRTTAAKTANYQILASDNFTLFDNTGAAGAVTFTLPPIKNGYYFGFSGRVAQNLAVTSTEGGNIVALNNAAANTLTFQTGGQQIGAILKIYSNRAGRLWIAENASAGAAAITVS
jgi:hypothetical protein